jgi:HAMP domain-containing protein
VPEEVALKVDERTEGEVEKQSRQRTQPLLKWPLASALLVLAVVVLLGAGFFFMRIWNQARTEPLGIVQTPVSTVAPATLAAAPPRPQEPTSVSTFAPLAIPPLAATPVPAEAGSVATAPQVAPTSALAQSGVETSPLPTAVPTVDPQIAGEVTRAYLRYWDVRAQALSDLDPDHLSDVAANGELTALQKSIEALRSQGNAIATSVEHHDYVMWSQGNQAQIVDRYRDRSVYIDPLTKKPIPGEVIPPSFQDAPESSVVYLLETDGQEWKVLGGQEYE